MKKGKVAIIGACLVVLLGGGAFGTSYYLSSSNEVTSTNQSSNIESNQNNNQVNTTNSESNNSKKVSNLNNESYNSKEVSHSTNGVASQSKAPTKSNEQSSNTTQQVSKTETIDNDDNTNTNDVGRTAYMNTVLKRVYVMKNPMHSDQAVGRISSGQVFSYIRTEGEWAYIKIGNVYGYIPAECVTFTKPTIVKEVQPKSYNNNTNPFSETTVSVYQYGYVVSNGAPVLNSPYGTEISTLSKGTSVFVETQSNQWCYIKVGSETGYMLDKYITYVNPIK